jgi:hypothetical protein
MKTRSVLAVLVFLSGVGLALAADTDLTMQMGTWKLNESKSTFAPGAAKVMTVVYAPAADNSVKVTGDGVDKDGKPTHAEWTGKFDGKDYPVTGSAQADMRSYTIVGKHSLSFVNKKAGKTVLTGKISISADGKTRTVTTSGDDPSLNATAVYDKQ